MSILESLGIIFIFLLLILFLIVIFTVVKDIIKSWFRRHRNKCPNCGAYLHGYRYNINGAVFGARYCSRCGKSLMSWNLNCEDYRKEKTNDDPKPTV